MAGAMEMQRAYRFTAQAPGDDAPDGAIAAMLANRNVHDRLYSGGKGRAAKGNSGFPFIWRLKVTQKTV